MNWKSSTATAVLLGLTFVSGPALSLSLDGALASFAREHGDGRVEELDMTQNGVSEILLVQDENCSSDGCAWTLMAQADGQVSEISSGLAHSVSLRATAPAGGVLYTDGITWALSETGLYPFGDLLGVLRQRPVSLAELEAIHEIEAYAEVTRDDVETRSFPYLIDGEEVFAHVHVITSRAYAIGEWGHPYLLFGEDGALIQEGISAEYPRIFPDPDAGGFSLIEVLPVGLSIQRFE